jgi:hypothetical protein
MAIHFGTFRQGDDADREPLDSLHAALAALGRSRCEEWFWALRNGEHRTLPDAAPDRLGSTSSSSAAERKPRSTDGCTP